MKKLAPKVKVAEKTLEKRVANDTQTPSGSLMFQAGVKDPDTGATYLDYDIRKLNGADEENLKNSTNKNKGKFINELLSRSITHIGPLSRKTMDIKSWYSLIQSLLIADQDLALMEIRKSTTGNEITIETNCPKCGAALKTEIEVEEFPILPYQGESSWEVKLEDGVEIMGEVRYLCTSRLPNGLDRELYLPIAEKNEAKGLTLLLTRTITFEGAVVNADTFRAMTMSDRRMLETDMNEHNFGYDLSAAEVDCPECGETYTVAVGNVNFS